MSRFLIVLWRVVWAVWTAFWAVFVVAITVSPKEAITRLSEWSQFLHLKEWVAILGYWPLLISAVIAAILGLAILLFVRFERFLDHALGEVATWHTLRPPKD